MKKSYKNSVEIPIRRMTEEEIKAILDAHPKEVARIQGKKNGTASWKSRTKGKSQKQVSDMMRDLRLKRVINLKK